MNLYNYSAETAEFVGTSPAALDPLESQAQGQDVFLIPANSTAIQPPAVGGNQVAVWSGSAWSLAEDYRGQTIYETSSGQSVVVSDIGALPEGWSLTQPVIPPSVNDVVAERKRRLGLGFSYDFGDARGVHQIGTTPNDMIGWREVIDYANALIDSGDTTTKIAIVTDTGPAEVTAPEWQAIMLVAASVRQNIWAKSFALQAMQPIPGDYANDSYWSQ